MKIITINQNDAGQRVDKFLTKFLPNMPKSMLYKLLRKKRVKLGKKALGAQDILRAGDELYLYINDEFFTQNEVALPAATTPPNVVYEDENILICDKPAGQPSHGGDDSLLTSVQSYLFQKGEYNPEKEQSFRPALSNRLDRNTRGLVLAAKNATCLRALNDCIKNGEVIKTYLAVANGIFKKKAGRIEGYLLSDTNQNKVLNVKKGTPDAKLAITEYEVIKEKNGLSLLRVTLLTGRKHQIRVQLSSIGHPLLGDTKYGAPKDNRFNYQALCACQLHFDLKENDGPLSQIAGKTVTLKDVDLFDDLFYKITMGCSKLLHPIFFSYFYLIKSVPINGISASGTRTEPSAF